MKTSQTRYCVMCQEKTEFTIYHDTLDTNKHVVEGQCGVCNSMQFLSREVPHEHHGSRTHEPERSRR